jgi:hypothetical protein
MAVSLRDARRTFARIRAAHGLTLAAVRLLSDPTANVKLSHSETDRVAAYGLNLLPADSYGDWQAPSGLSETVPAEWFAILTGRANTCRFASPGCRAACLATSGQAGMERRAGRDRLYRARRAKLAFLLVDPAAFLRVLVAEIDAMQDRAAAALQKLDVDPAGWTVSLRLNVLSDLPWETLAPWILRRATGQDGRHGLTGIRAYDYTAWPTSRRSRDAADVVGLYLVDSVKETHTDAEIAAMRRPVVVVDVKRGRDLPTVWRGRPAHDADRSDARFLDPADSVSLLRYKHVATCTAADALASGFVKQA